MKTTDELLAEIETLKAEALFSYEKGRRDEQDAIISYVSMLSKFPEYEHEMGLDQIIVDVAGHDLHLKDQAWRNSIKATLGTKPYPYTVIELDDYQKTNLKWLFELCGYPYGGGVKPFTFANTGDWLGEIYLRLGEAKGKPNIAKEHIQDIVTQWREGADL